MVEALELVEMYCDLLLARFGLISNMKELDEGLSEAVSSLIWVAPRIQSDVQVFTNNCLHLSLLQGQINNTTERFINKK